MDHEYPLISVGMPVRNGGSTLRYAIESVLDQDYRNIELIISDNQSTDSTQAEVGEIAKRDPRVRYIRQPTSLRALQNFLFVLNEAKGDFFMWAAHDDLRSSNYISSLLPAFNDEKTILAFPDVFVFNEFGGEERYVPFNFDNRGMGLLARLRKQALIQCYHIYGLWRTQQLRSLPSVEAPWWGDLPIMMGAAAKGEFVYVAGAKFCYFEQFKSDLERAKYQDGARDLGKARYIMLLMRATYAMLRPLTGRRKAMFGALFALEKSIYLGCSSVGRRVSKWGYSR